MTDRIRTTISLPQEVHEIFKQMADASGLSVSRCMGDWLAETADGAQHVSMQLQRAREASLRGIRDLHTALKSGESMDKFTTKISGAAGRTEPRNARPAAPRPPYSNTGLKSPSGGKVGGKKS